MSRQHSSGERLVVNYGDDFDLIVVKAGDGHDGAAAALSRQNFTAKFEPGLYNRKPLRSIDETIDKIWDEKCSENPRLFNGSKFRLAGCCRRDDKDEDDEGDRWELKLGLTCYKDLCATNLSPDYRWIQECGLRDYGDSQAYMSDALGVGLLAMTTDNCLVVTRRADWTAESPGALDRPGGHPEPGSIFHHDGSLLKGLKEGQSVCELVADEVWNAAVLEFEAEVGVKSEHLRGREVRLMGVDLNRSAGGKPSLEFFVRLCVPSQDVQSWYSLEQQEEADETTEMYVVVPDVLVHLPHLLLPRPHLSAKCPEEERESGWRRDSDGRKTLNAGGKWRDVEREIAGGGEMSSSSSSGGGNGSSGGGGGGGGSSSEAMLIVRQATPALKAALTLACLHRLLPP